MHQSHLWRSFWNNLSFMNLVGFIFTIHHGFTLMHIFNLFAQLTLLRFNLWCGCDRTRSCRRWLRRLTHSWYLSNWIDKCWSTWIWIHESIHRSWKFVFAHFEHLSTIFFICRPLAYVIRTKEKHMKTIIWKKIVVFKISRGLIYKCRSKQGHFSNEGNILIMFLFLCKIRKNIFLS